MRFMIAASLLGAAGAGIAAGTAHAAGDYPSKPVRIVVPYPAGGSTDTITRLLGQALAQRWDKPVVVENRGGASGMIGADEVARADADGYTLLMNGSGPHTVNISLFDKISYDPVKDFAPIIQTTTIPLLMVVPANSPHQNVQGFIDWARANAGEVNYCSIGPGSPSHLAGELFKSSAKVEMTHIPYKGSGPALVDTIGGVCHVLFDSALSAGPHVKSGKLRALAIGTEKRVASWPDTPTVAESGVPGFSAYTWTALFAPDGTPDEVVRKIQKDAAEILASPEISEKLEAQGALPGGGSSEALAAFVDSEIAKWAQVIKAGNITAN